MKTTDLSKTDKAIVADWFESDAYQVFKKVLELRRQANASLLLTATKHEHILKVQGAAQEDRDLHQYFQSVNKEAREKQS